MKNITITLSDAMAHRARIEAAHAEKSVSRFIADLLAEKVSRRPRRQNLQREAIERFLAGPDIDASHEPGRPLREEIYAGFRGHERHRLRARPQQRRKTR
jgi:hypothetical protein